ncbi:MAG: protein-glutamate O-methyltransferase CheR, partial [bacterium]|nr:protein-glutamate O-methyltransferase CheR [bacterium]
RSGISIEPGKEYLLENRLANRLKAQNCSSFEEYHLFLRYEPEGEKEIERMIDCVTTNETYFFRENDHFEALKDVMLPALVEQKRREGERTIRIWSAACSIGAEPYSIAILLSEMGARLGGLKTEIIASDISQSVIESARRGVYGENTVRKVPQALLDKYFSREGNNWRLQDAVKSRVRFANLNLVDPIRLQVLSEVDVIFCKNVLIYFDEETKKRVLQSLYDALCPSGYLVVSLSETLHNVTRVFKPQSAGCGLVYRKE